MKKIILCLTLLLAAPFSFAQIGPPPPTIYENGGSILGPANTVNCSTNMSCSLSNGVLTVVGSNTTGATAFSAVTAGTNAAALVIGTGGSLTVSGSGTNNATTLLAGTWAIPGTIGSTTPNTGAFTTLSASSTVSGTGFSNYLASPPAIGGTAPASGSFTTLSASSTVSGTGFSTYLASPPAIGGTAAAAGSFTTLSASSTVSGTGFSTYLASPPAIGGTAPAAGNFTTVTLTGNLTTNITGSTQCVQVNSSGVESGAGSGCTTNALPATVSGTVNSGGIPYFSSPTQESSSATLTANALIQGGGAATAPSSSLYTDNGTTGTYSGTGGFQVAAQASNSGMAALVGGTSNQTIPANSAAIGGPTASNLTSYGVNLPNASPATNSVLVTVAPSGSWSPSNWLPLPSCSGVNTALQYNTSTPGFQCNNSAGGAAGSYAQPFTAQTSVTIAGTTHNLGTPNIAVAVVDNESPAAVIIPSKVTIDQSSYNVVVTFATSQTGTIILVAGAGKYVACFTNQTTYSVPASTHKLGATIFNVSFYDSCSGTRNRITPGSLSIDASGNVTAVFAIAQSGQIAIE